MGERIDNSFFHQDYSGLRVLVLAPHPDDEINVAGNVIYTLSKMGAEIFVLYSTNGDFDGQQELRFREVERSLAILGVDAEHYELLGYGDTYNNTGRPCHVYHAEAAMTSPAGHNATYGAGGREEYHYRKHGTHSAYTKNDFLADLQEYLLDVRADVVFCVDYDRHADHRALSLGFEKVMGDILSRKGNTYFPTVYKRFAYGTGFTAIQDFSDINLLSVRRPCLDANESYNYDIIDKSVYQWDLRVRFPVHADLRGKFFKDNPMAQAIFAHKSQHNEKNAYGLINSDEVFWQRRTDNLAFKADIKAGPEGFGSIAAFQLLDPVDINTEIPEWKNEAWKPRVNSLTDKIVYSWETPQKISRICLYGSLMDAYGPKVRITFDDGETVISRELNKQGNPTVVKVSKENVKELSLQLVDADDDKCGISYCEIFAEASPAMPIKPYIKILVNDDFAYSYGCVKDQKEIKLSCYGYGVDGKKIFYKVLSGNAHILGSDILIWENDEPVRIEAFVENDKSIFDRIELYRVGIREKISNQVRTLMNKCYLKMYR